MCVCLLWKKNDKKNKKNFIENWALWREFRESVQEEKGSTITTTLYPTTKNPSQKYIYVSTHTHTLNWSTHGKVTWRRHTLLYTHTANQSTHKHSADRWTTIEKGKKGRQKKGKKKSEEKVSTTKFTARPRYFDHHHHHLWD